MRNAIFFTIMVKMVGSSTTTKMCSDILQQDRADWCNHFDVSIDRNYTFDPSKTCTTLDLCGNCVSASIVHLEPSDCCIHPDSIASCTINEYKSGGYCYPLTTCTSLEYEETPPSSLSNRVCATLTVCSANQYESVAVTTTTDRVCAPLTVCVDGQYEDSAATTTSNRVCANHCAAGEYYNNANCEPLTICGAHQYENATATLVKDRVCVNWCQAEEYMSVAPITTTTLTSIAADAVCTPLTVCDQYRYQSVAPTTTTNRVCQLVTICGDDQYQTIAPTATIDRVCAPLTVCAAGFGEITAPTMNIMGQVVVHDGSSYPEYKYDESIKCNGNYREIESKEDCKQALLAGVNEFPFNLGPGFNLYIDGAPHNFNDIVGNELQQYDFTDEMPGCTYFWSSNGKNLDVFYTPVTYYKDCSSVASSLQNRCRALQICKRVPPLAVSDRQCVACTGNTFSSMINGTKKCTPATVCEAINKCVVLDNTAVADTVCVTCMTCPAGQYEVSAPTRNADTGQFVDRTCASCDHGKYTTESNEKVCISWSSCGSNQYASNSICTEAFDDNWDPIEYKESGYCDEHLTLAECKQYTDGRMNEHWNNNAKPEGCTWNSDRYNPDYVKFSEDWKAYYPPRGCEGFRCLCKSPCSVTAITTDRVCSDVTGCGVHQSEVASATATSNTQCRDKCNGGKYWKDGCEPWSPACAADEYETVAPTAANDRVCTTTKQCGAGQYETVAPTTTTDRVCAPITVCGAVQYETVAPLVRSFSFKEENNCDQLIENPTECNTAYKQIKPSDSSSTKRAYKGFLEHETQNQPTGCYVWGNKLYFNTFNSWTGQEKKCGTNNNFFCICKNVVARVEASGCGTASCTDRVCENWCDEDEYMSVAGTAMSNPVCTSLTVCNGDEYESAAPTATTNRVCTSLMVCAAAEYESAAPTATTNRVCTSLTVCAAAEYESAAPTATTNRVCTILSLSTECGPGKYNSIADDGLITCRSYTGCGTDEYQSTAPTATSDRNCTSLTYCVAGQYESTAPTTTNNRKCTMLPTECVAGQYESVSQSATTNQVCSWIKDCAAAEYESAAPTTTNNRVTSDRVCTPVTTCEAGQYTTANRSATSNRRCASCPVGKYTTGENEQVCQKWSICDHELLAIGTRTKDQTCIVYPKCTDNDGIDCAIVGAPSNGGSHYLIINKRVDDSNRYCLSHDCGLGSNGVYSTNELVNCCQTRTCSTFEWWYNAANWGGDCGGNSICNQKCKDVRSAYQAKCFATCTAVTLCDENFYVYAGSCVHCSTGTTNAAGDDPSGTDTTCDLPPCAENHRVSAGSCVACSTGTTNAAGDDPSGTDTTCASCAENYHVSGGSCVPCPDGSTNDAGDVPSGTDTTCETLCSTDQRVVSNECIACPHGYGRDAGDDASGTDTSCSLCAENYYGNGAGSCIACPTGFEHPAGANPSGDFVFCTLCAENYYASTGSCLQCPTGKTIAAGSVLSEGQTTCA